MMPDTINYTMLLVVLGAAAYAIILRESPKALRHLAAWAIARAIALEKFRAIQAQERKRWEIRLGVQPAPAPAPRPYRMPDWCGKVFRRPAKPVDLPQTIRRAAGGGA